VNSSAIDYIRKSRRDEGLILLEKRKRISERKNIYSNNYKSDELKRNFKKITGIAINSLIDTRKKAVKLYLLNLTLDEIAIVCNWSRDKTRNLLYRGLTDLKQKLSDMGFEYENK
jgi:RNA polymerase sigma-70 factor (ECF subfamily)